MIFQMWRRASTAAAGPAGSEMRHGRCTIVRAGAVMSISLSGRASRSRSRIPGHTVLFDTIAGQPGGDIRRLTDVAMQIARSS
jgi:hypothetical protein